MSTPSQAAFFLVFILVLAAFNFFLWQEILSWDGQLHTIFFDVGQGDAIFFETPNNHQILIDGGPNQTTILEKLAQQMPFWDRSLDLIVLTHPDYDHLSGLNAVLEHYKVDNILWTGAERGTRAFEEWQNKIKQEGARLVLAQKGQTIKAGSLLFQVIHPEQDLEHQFFEDDSNETSIVALALYGSSSFLLPGDIPAQIEREVVSSSGPLWAQVLKISHHGSRISSDEEFLKAVSPEIAVISVAENNPYNHPHPSVLQNLKKFGIKVLRTDLEGDIELVSDGQSLSLIDY